MHCNKQERLRRLQPLQRRPDSRFSNLQATAVLSEIRKRAKQKTVRTQPLHAKHSKNYSRRIRAVRCFSVASALHIVQTIRHAHLISIDVPQKFNQMLPNTRLVMEQHWSRRVASRRRHTYCARLLKRFLITMRRTRISRSRSMSRSDIRKDRKSTRLNSSH